MVQRETLEEGTVHTAYISNEYMFEAVSNYKLDKVTCKVAKTNNPLFPVCYLQPTYDEDEDSYRLEIDTEKTEWFRDGDDFHTMIKDALELVGVKINQDEFTKFLCLFEYLTRMHCRDY